VYHYAPFDIEQCKDIYTEKASGKSWRISHLKSQPRKFSSVPFRVKERFDNAVLVDTMDLGLIANPETVDHKLLTLAKHYGISDFNKMIMHEDINYLNFLSDLGGKREGLILLDYHSRDLVVLPLLFDRMRPVLDATFNVAKAANLPFRDLVHGTSSMQSYWLKAEFAKKGFIGDASYWHGLKIRQIQDESIELKKLKESHLKAEFLNVPRKVFARNNFVCYVPRPHYVRGMMSHSFPELEPLISQRFDLQKDPLEQIVYARFFESMLKEVDFDYLQIHNLELKYELDCSYVGTTKFDFRDYAIQFSRLSGYDIALGNFKKGISRFERLFAGLRKSVERAACDMSLEKGVRHEFEYLRGKLSEAKPLPNHRQHLFERYNPGIDFIEHLVGDREGPDYFSVAFEKFTDFGHDFFSSLDSIHSGLPKDFRQLTKHIRISDFLYLVAERDKLLELRRHFNSKFRQMQNVSRLRGDGPSDFFETYHNMMRSGYSGLAGFLRQHGFFIEEQRGSKIYLGRQADPVESKDLLKACPHLIFLSQEEVQQKKIRPTPQLGLF
jgi:hypothetical protein